MVFADSDRGDATRISVRKKISTGISKISATPSITLTKRLKYLSIEMYGFTPAGMPIDSRNSRP